MGKKFIWVEQILSFHYLRIRIYLLARRNLLWDILRLPSSHRAALGLCVILTLWRARGANQPPYAVLHIGACRATHCATGDDNNLLTCKSKWRRKRREEEEEDWGTEGERERRRWILCQCMSVYMYMYMYITNIFHITQDHQEVVCLVVRSVRFHDVQWFFTYEHPLFLFYLYNTLFQ